MPRVPLHIRMDVIELYDQHQLSEKTMEAGGPGPIEETYNILERVRRHQEEVEKAFRAGLKMGSDKI